MRFVENISIAEKCRIGIKDQVVVQLSTIPLPIPQSFLIQVQDPIPIPVQMPIPVQISIPNPTSIPVSTPMPQ